MKIRKIDFKSLNYVRFFSIILTAVVIMLTLGYATTEDTLAIDSKAYVRVEADVRVTGFALNTSANGGTSLNEEYGKDFVKSTTRLPNNNSTVTYTVQVTNFGNAEMGIRSITGLPNNLEYTLTGYTLEAALCDSNNNSILRICL